jgi:alkylation response protein AidB-like acyl-CoA dehydrogenase
MDFDLSPEQQRLKGLARELAKDFATRAAAHDRDRSAPLENYAALRDAGMFGLAIPRELGGLGVGAIGWVAVAEELAQGCGATALAFNMHMNATGGISDRQRIAREVRQRVADLAIRQGKLMCTSATEPGTSSLLPSSYVFSIEARRVPGGYRIYGRKTFCSMVEASDYCYLFAHPQNHPNPTQLVALLVDSKQKEVTFTDIWDTLGMRATRSNQADFDGAFVPDELVLYEISDFARGFIAEESTWAFGGFAACYLGVGLGIVKWAQDFLSHRMARGHTQVMGYHPDVAHRVGDMVTEIEAARCMVYRAAWEHDAHGPTMAAFDWFLRAKLAVGNALQRIINNVTIACGVNSLMRARELERMIRDAMTGPIMPPASDACSGAIGLMSMGLDLDQAPALRTEDPSVTVRTRK